MKVFVAQSCPTLCNPIDCTPPGSSVHGILQARMLEWGSHSLLQGIFLTQGLNPGLLHCRWILYQRSYQESPGPQRSLRELEVLAAYTVRGTPPLTQASSVGGPSPEPHCRPGSLALSALVHLVLYCLFPSCLLGVSSDSSSFCIFQLLSFFVISFGCSDTI